MYPGNHQEYLNLVLVQDILIASLNVFLLLLESDYYWRLYRVLYWFVGLPFLVILLSLIILVMKFEYMKNNTFTYRMNRYNVLRSYASLKNSVLLAACLLCLLAHLVVLAFDLRNHLADDDSAQRIVQLVAYGLYALAFVLFLSQFGNVLLPLPSSRRP